MMFLRFLLEVVLTILLLPLIVVIEILWLFWCIRSTKMVYNGTIKDGVKLWFEYIKAGLKMNLDFIVNGL